MRVDNPDKVSRFFIILIKLNFDLGLVMSYVCVTIYSRVMLAMELLMCASVCSPLQSKKQLSLGLLNKNIRKMTGKMDVAVLFFIDQNHSTRSIISVVVCNNAKLADT